MKKSQYFQALSIVSAAGLILSAWLPWVFSEKAKNLPLRGLFNTNYVTPTNNIFSSLGLIVLLIAIVALIGAILKSRIWAAIAAFVALVTSVWWTSSTASTLAPLHFSAKNLESGVWVVYSATLLLIIASFLGAKTAKMVKKPVSKAAESNDSSDDEE